VGAGAEFAAAAAATGPVPAAHHTTDVVFLAAGWRGSAWLLLRFRRCPVVGCLRSGRLGLRGGFRASAPSWPRRPPPPISCPRRPPPPKYFLFVRVCGAPAAAAVAGVAPLSGVCGERRWVRWGRCGSRLCAWAGGGAPFPAAAARTCAAPAAPPTPNVRLLVVSWGDIVGCRHWFLRGLVLGHKRGAWCDSRAGFPVWVCVLTILLRCGVVSVVFVLFYRRPALFEPFDRRQPSGTRCRGLCADPSPPTVHIPPPPAPHHT